MSFEIKILGSNSASPVLNRHQSGQLISIEQIIFLVDCGEATQYQLLKYRAKINRIDYIFISHLHGDHYLGLVGLISTMHLQGRTKELHVYGPQGLDDIITLQLKISETFLNFKIIYREIDTTRVLTILDLPQLTVETIPLKHRILCAGFLFREKPKKRRLRREIVPDNISLAQIAKLRNGENVNDENGNLLYNSAEFTMPPKKSRSYAYCSDTIYWEPNIEQVKGVDLLYHEATFLHNLKERAAVTFHSTAAEAGIFAEKASVKQLVIGHFSSRYKDLNPHLEEARSYFSNTALAIEGLTFIIPDE